MKIEPMLYKIVYFDEARQDVREAKAWYKKQKEGLEKQFATAVKKAILKLLERPFSHAVRYKNIRISHPNKFPYAIHFYVDDIAGYIVIIAIVHNSRHPNVGNERI